MGWRKYTIHSITFRRSGWIPPETVRVIEVTTGHFTIKCATYLTEREVNGAVMKFLMARSKLFIWSND